MSDFDDGELQAVPEDAVDDEVNVLFVEDDNAVADMYRLKLELDGYSVTVAADGETAVKLAFQSPPDLVFLDIRLPTMDGFQVLELLRNDDRTRYVPVVILSNYGEEDLVDRGFRLGALEYLIKSQTTPSRVSHSIPSWVRSAVARKT